MAVHVGLMSVRISVNGSRSLKEKRRVVKSLIDRLRAQHNLSVAEVEDQDQHQAATLALACVANEESYINSVLDTAINWLATDRRIVILETELEMW